MKMDFLFAFGRRSDFCRVYFDRAVRFTWLIRHEESDWRLRIMLRRHLCVFLRLVLHAEKK